MQSPPLDVASLYAAHSDYVWTRLYYLGVHTDDLEDMLQEVFLVVHRRIHTCDGGARIKPWLFAICVRVASTYRRRAHRRREHIVDMTEDQLPGPGDVNPEEVATNRQAYAKAASILDGMDLDKRAVFILFEIERRPCQEISALMGIPVGTVYSRLHAARKFFETGVAALLAAERTGGSR